MRILTGIIAMVSFGGVIIDLLITENPLKLFNYYTIQSNLLVGALCLWIIVSKSKENKIKAMAVTSVTLWISATGIIYHLLLSGLYHPVGLRAVANIMLHYITPLLMLIFFIHYPVDKNKGRLLWLSYPILYTLGSIIRGALDGFYPYWFLNPTGSYPNGIGSLMNVLLFAIGMCLIFVVFGEILWYLGKRYKRMMFER